MRIAICGSCDAYFKKTREFIKEHFKDKPSVRVYIQEYHSGEELLVENELTDVAFLDMDVPNMDEACVGKSLKHRNRDAIVVIQATESNKWKTRWACKGFLYMLPPYDEDIIHKGLDDAVAAQDLYRDKIIVDTEVGKYAFEFDEIMYFAKIGDSVYIHTLCEDFRTVKDMDYWREYLNKILFFEPSRRYLINLRLVTKYESGTVYMYDDTPIPLTYHQYYKLKKALGEFYRAFSRYRRH